MNYKKLLYSGLVLWTIICLVISSYPRYTYAQEIPPPPVITAPPPPVITAPPSDPTVAPSPDPVITAPPPPEISIAPPPVVSSPTPFPTPTVALDSDTSPTPTTGESQPTGSSGSTGSTGSEGSGEIGPTGATGVETGSKSEIGNSGDTTINTGNGTTSGIIVTDGNTNESASIMDGATGSIVANDGNGAHSDNSATVQNSSNTSTNQNNSAQVANTMNLTSDTGGNTIAKNTGGDSVIKTGDANVSGTIITSVNTNVNGVLISEFTVDDNHTGDIVLEFAPACTNECNTTQSAANTNNGAGSDNAVVLGNLSQADTFQNNDASVQNVMTLTADSGNNMAYKNTDGASSIETGDANVQASALTFANNNLDGNVVYSVVNIYGDLTGDIIFPEEQMENCCSTANIASNQNNGDGSTNSAINTSSNDRDVTQSNTATINNSINVNAETGSNDTNKNTGGDIAITTGDSNVSANVVNVANTNISGGNWFIVFINEAGQWIGKIIGAPEGAMMAGSEGSEFRVNENGEVIVSNNGNGVGSENSSNTEQITTNTVTQNNSADIGNTLNLSANTGHNTASYNTGGDTTVKTGDAKIIANIVNFVNNNITGGGKLFVTVVNVFGSWVGDFVGPGQKKTETAHMPDPTPTVQPIEIGVLQPSIRPVISPITTVTPTPIVSVQTAYVEPLVTPTVRVLQRRSRPMVAGMAIEIIEPTPPAFDSMSGVLNDATITPAPLVKGKSVVKINLAYLIYLIPCVILLVVLRRIAHKLSNSNRIATNIT